MAAINFDFDLVEDGITDYGCRFDIGRYSALKIDFIYCHNNAPL